MMALMETINFLIPDDSSRQFLLDRMEARWAPRLDVRLAGAALVLGWNGTPEDRELARDEIGAALAEAHSQQLTVTFLDEAQP